MTFQEILPHLLKGEKIRRKFWVEPKEDHVTGYLTLDDHNKGIVDWQGRNYDISSISINAKDWEIYKEPEPEPKPLTFTEAVEHMKKGGLARQYNSGYLTFKDNMLCIFSNDRECIRFANLTVSNTSRDWYKVDPETLENI